MKEITIQDLNIVVGSAYTEVQCVAGMTRTGAVLGAILGEGIGAAGGQAVGQLICAPFKQW